jgi:DNA-binding MarR family transcriptional regulator
MKKILTNQEKSLGYVIGRAGRALANRLNHNFEKAGHDVTSEQWAVLTNLWQKNGQNQKDLAGVTCKDKTSITRLIDVLEKKSLVVRTPDKLDARHKLIYLTNKGKALQQALVAIAQKTLVEAQEGIQVRNLEICKTVLRQVAKNLSEVLN